MADLNYIESLLEIIGGTLIIGSIVIIAILWKIYLKIVKALTSLSKDSQNEKDN